MSLPFDNAKTKMQRQNMLKDSTPYKNIFDAMMKEVRKNGPRGLWVGYTTFLFRIVPHAMISLVVAEHLKKIFY